MKLSATTKSIILEIICLLYVLLFVYAAVSKLLDFENFQVQLGQSPLLSAFAGWVAVAVPVGELAIAGLLAYPPFRFKALVGSYMLMTMFTVYIYLILNYSAFIPCSCGGILEKMNWDQHLVFNIVFMALAVVGLFCSPSSVASFQYKVIVLVSGTLLAGGLVVGLFMLSENKMKYDNGFVRRFPQHSAQEIHQRELTYNSYYFAGVADDKIYLGNHTSPLLITIIDTSLQSEQSLKIELVEKDLPFRSPSIRVFENHFYVYEGVAPYIFKGSIANWKASLRMHSGHTFSQFEPIDSVNIAVRYSDPKTAQNIIGTLNLADTTKIKYNPLLLEKQIDGIFDTDGKLHFNSASLQLVYLYLYRNEYIISSTSLKFLASGHTIDTISQARIKIAEVKSHGIHTFSAPPLIVNKSSAVDHNYLYSNSLLRGKYESDYRWKNNSIVDVYRLTDQSYQYSLSLSTVEDKKMKSFIVLKDRLYALIGTKIVAYKLIDYKEIEPMTP